MKKVSDVKRLYQFIEIHKKILNTLQHYSTEYSYEKTNYPTSHYRVDPHVSGRFFLFFFLYSSQGIHEICQISHASVQRKPSKSIYVYILINAGREIDKSLSVHASGTTPSTAVHSLR